MVDEQLETEEVRHTIEEDEVEHTQPVVLLALDEVDANEYLLLGIQLLVDIISLDELNILVEIILSIALHLIEL